MRWSTTTARSTPGSSPRSPLEPDLSAGGRQRRIVGPLDDADALQREVAQPGSSQDELLVDRAEDARILARGPVVAHHEVLVVAHDPGHGAVGPRADCRFRRALFGASDVRL